MNKENILEPGRVIQEESPAQEVVEQDLALLEDDIEVQSSRKVSKKKVPRRKTKISLRTGSKAKEGTRQTRKSTPAREKKKPVVLFMFIVMLAGLTLFFFLKGGDKTSPVILSLPTVAESTAIRLPNRVVKESSPFDESTPADLVRAKNILGENWHKKYFKSQHVTEVPSLPGKGVKLIQVKSAMSESLGKSWISFNFTKPVQKNDVLMLGFFVRSLKKNSIYGIIEAKVVKTSKIIQLTDKWQHIQIPLKCDHNRGLKSGKVIFSFGAQEHHFELARLELLNFGSKKSLASLPKYKFIFKPMSKAEKEAADERIEKIRKGDLQLSFLDKSNKALSGAQIEITQLSHAFPFGSAISTGVYARGISSQEREQYFKYFEKNFNHAVFENAMKWRSKDYKENPNTEEILSFLEEKNIPYRGHVLTWPSFKKSPEYLQGLKDKPALLQQEVMNHIKDFSSRWAKATDWDVLNEPFSNYDLMDCLPKGSASQWFKQAGKYLPDHSQLCINDFGILSGFSTKQRNHYYNFIKKLLSEGTQIDAIGFQSHFKYAHEVSLIKERLDRFTAMDKKLKITEFDLTLENIDEEVQAQFLHDFLTMSFSHPSVDAFIMWGFWDKRHWRENCGLYRADWSLRPQGRVWQELTQKKWWSQAKAKTNETGKLEGRFFFGNYKVKVKTKDGKSFEREIDFRDNTSNSHTIREDN